MRGYWDDGMRGRLTKGGQLRFRHDAMESDSLLDSHCWSLRLIGPEERRSDAEDGCWDGNQRHGESLRAHPFQPADGGSVMKESVAPTRVHLAGVAGGRMAVPGFCAPAPLGATLSGLPERKPSGIPVAVVCDHGAVVSTSFPSRLSRDGFPAPPAMERHESWDSFLPRRATGSSYQANIRTRNYEARGV